MLFLYSIAHIKKYESEFNEKIKWEVEKDEKDNFTFFMFLFVTCCS